MRIEFLIKFPMMFFLIIGTITCLGVNIEKQKYSRVKVSIPFTNHKPVIDGILEEKWQNAWTMNLLVNKRKDRNPLQPTIVKLMWDHNNLYVAFICYDKNICRKIYTRDSNLWQVNHDTEICEMMLCFDKSGKNYYEFNLHPSGALLDLNVRWKNKKISFDKSWNSKTACRVYIHQDKGQDIFWSAEFAVPWSSFNFIPEPGAHFSGNFYRADNSKKPGRFAWIPTNAWFHVPEKFGTIHLSRFEKLK